MVLPPGTQDINCLPMLCPLTLGCCNRINNRNYVYLLVLMQYGSYTALAPYTKLMMPTVVNYTEGCQPFSYHFHQETSEDRNVCR